MRYLLLFVTGIVLFFLGILLLKGFTGVYVSYSNAHVLFHWFIFGILTASVPRLSEFIINTNVIRLVALIIACSCLSTALLIYVLWYEVSGLNVDIGEINFIYINLFYFISILLTLSVIKRIRS